MATATSLVDATALNEYTEDLTKEYKKYFALIKNEVVVVTIKAISSLPTGGTVWADPNNTGLVTSNHIILHSYLSNPAAQVGNWSVTTNTDTIKISGSISGTTDLTLYLGLRTSALTFT